MNYLEIKKEFTKYGYKKAKRIGKWRDYMVYEPFFSANQIHYIGYPQFLLVKGEKMRWTKSIDESLEIMDTFLS